MAVRSALNGFHAASVIGVTALVTTTLTAAALVWPNSPPARLLNLSATHEARATAALVLPNPSPSDLALAQQETVRSLRQAPANPTAWLRLAYIDSRRPEGLGDFGIAALRNSYAIAPYGPDDTAWRLRFALNHWARLDRPTRLLVLDELRLALSNGSASVRGLEDDVLDPAGRLAVELTAAEARSFRPQQLTATHG